ncbi:MAG: TIGR01777 family oxidoreductase [Thermodesulfobacteriota bacterium]|jgi:uncharacterized protein (TIGR01777 family)
MKILITGGTGFVGTHLCARFLQDGHEVTILTRSRKGPEEGPAGISYLPGDPTQKGPWQEAIQNHEVIVNLAGASIFSRWTAKQKKAIRESRVSTTGNIVEGMPSHPEKKITLFSTSAVGYYGFCGDEELVEDSPAGSDFLARLAVEWEGEALKAKDKGARVVITRFGIVLGEKGGALSQMIPLFKRYMGGPIGSGKQWFSWIHIKDLAAAFVFLMKPPEISGPVNICSPNPVRNRDLAKALGRVLHRPSFVPAPGFMLKWVLGEFGSVILEGQRVIPRWLLDHGFVFQYPDIDKALQSIVGR